MQVENIERLYMLVIGYQPPSENQKRLLALAWKYLLPEHKRTLNKWTARDTLDGFEAREPFANKGTPIYAAVHSLYDHMQLVRLSDNEKRHSLGVSNV